jgi:hypothetical protein
VSGSSVLPTIVAEPGFEAKTMAKVRTASVSTMVPILYDARRSLEEGLGMTRFGYFTVECDVPGGVWTLGVGGSEIPFLMLGLEGIVLSPSRDEGLFDSPQTIRDALDRIEEDPSLTCFG